MEVFTMYNTEFKPCLRVMVVSDIHIKDEHSAERERFEKAIRDAYSIAKSNKYYQTDKVKSNLHSHF